MYTFCTIITPNYLPYALALQESLLQQSTNVLLYVFISTNDRIEGKGDANTVFISNPDICADGLGKQLYDKYFDTNKDAFRWGMKPVLLKYILGKQTTEVVYVDCDIHFYSDFTFLFDDLIKNRILLTPHNRASDPLVDPFGFQRNFMEGIYNAGFIGASKGAEEVLDWLANACLYKCVFDYANGYFVDQKYLDFIPARFDGIMSVKHKGCNIADWNLIDCKRSLENGKVKINKIFDIVFMHFVPMTFMSILKGDDPLLLPYAQTYNNRLLKHGLVEDQIAKYEFLCHPELFEQLSRKLWLKNRIKKVFRNITFNRDANNSNS